MRIKKKRRLFNMLDNLVYTRSKSQHKEERDFYTRQIKVIMNKIEGK